MKEAMVLQFRSLRDFRRARLAARQVIGTFVFIFSLFPSPIHAQSTSLSLTPPVTEILLAPGKTVTQVFTLTSTNNDLNIVPELHLARSSDQDGHMIIDPTPLNQDALPVAIKISGPNTSPTLTFSAANTDTPTDTYIALVFRAESSSLLSTIHNPRSTTFSPAISALILVTINPSGIIPINLEIKDFTPSLFHDSWLPLTIHPSLENKTSTMIRPTGTFKIISPRGKIVISTPLYQNLILGNSSRRILGSHTQCEGSPHTGCVDSTSNPLPLTWSPKWYNMGPYRLHLTIATQGNTKISETEKIIWVIPLRLITILVLLTTILVIILRPKKSELPIDNTLSK